MKSEAVKYARKLLEADSRVSDYKINVSKKESYELFFVKGQLETVRATDTCDRKLTLYVDHDGFRGDSAFYIYPSTSHADIEVKINEAVRSALLIRNQPYALPANAAGAYVLASNLDGEPMPALAERIAQTVFAANAQPQGSLNSVEIFLNRYTESVANSRGLDKSQQRYDAMVEAIPTFNGERESVELYEQYNFTAFDKAALSAEIAGKMAAVKARYEALKPASCPACKVVLHKQELNDLFSNIAGDLNYSRVYGHSNLFRKGDRIQKACTGDPITICMKGAAAGNVNSSSFDIDGVALGEITLVEGGEVKNYYGANRFGQYLGETPTGNLGCLCVASGTVRAPESEPYLEVIAMSGLQVDFFNDYIGGEVRLAYYHARNTVRPLTGISISGKLTEVLNKIRLSADTDIYNGYIGPASAVCEGFVIF